MAGLLTCGSLLARTFPDPKSPVVYLGVARHLQLRGQLWNWDKVPHHIPFSSIRLRGWKPSTLLNAISGGRVKG